MSPAAAPSPGPVELLKQLVSRRSVTPDDAGCQQLIAQRLAAAGFKIRNLPFGPVLNLWASHGSGRPTLVFLGHTDVVPSGPPEHWRSPPFEPTEEQGLLYGRGTADMKASVAAMVVALERFVHSQPEHSGQIGLLLTSDEEGLAEDGMRKVIPSLSNSGLNIDYCVVGEPSSIERLGDNARIGRRGSLNGKLTIIGIQGHAAYPELARNPIHQAMPALNQLCAMEWDQGNADFPATSFQLSNIHAGAGVNNVIPGSMELSFNFRFSPELSDGQIRQRVTEVLDRHGLEYQLEWQLSGHPFHTPPGRLTRALSAAVESHCGKRPKMDTGGGTSDGRFVAPTGAQVVEFGPVNASIHKIDEHVCLADVDTLALIYHSVLEELVG